MRKTITVVKAPSRQKKVSVQVIKPDWATYIES